MGSQAAPGGLAAKLPDTARRWTDGSLSYGQVEAIANNLDAETVELFAGHEAELVPSLVDLSAKDVGVVMRAWRDIATADRELPPERPQRLHLSPNADRWRLDGDLDGETGELLATALRTATTGDVEGEPHRSFRPSPPLRPPLAGIRLTERPLYILLNVK